MYDDLFSEQTHQESISSSHHQSTAILTPVTAFVGQPPTYFPQEHQELDLNSPSNQNQHSNSNLTSVFSSFSNYLRLGSGPSRQTEEELPAPPLLDNLISEPPSDAPPVPLFDPTTPLGRNSEPPPPLLTGGKT